MYTIDYNGLTFTGDFVTVTSKYLALRHMLGGDDGYAYLIKVTLLGEEFDMEKWLEGARKMLAPS